MTRFLIAATAAFFLLACSNDGKSDDPNPSPVKKNPAGNSVAGNGNGQSENNSNSEIEGGTIVGNGGDNTALRFTLHGLKSFEYWEKQLTLPRQKKYVQCGQDLKKTEDALKPWTEKEWQEKLLKACGSEPSPSLAYFDEANRALKITKLFLSDEFNCSAGTICGSAWQSFPKEQKIYISPRKWNQLAEQDKVKEALLAYDSLLSESQKNLVDQLLVLEIHRKVFLVDFSMDTFRAFVDERGLEIIDDGSQVYNQQKIVEQMSLAMDCIRLVEKRFPNQLDIKEISLIEDDEYYYGSLGFLDKGGNDARVIFHYDLFRLEQKAGYGLRTTEKRLLLGQAVNLQKCYNSLVSQGIKNPLLETVEQIPMKKSQLKPPMSGESELVLEFVNISFKSLDYVIQDQMKAWESHQSCLNENPGNGQHGACKVPLISLADLERLGDVFSSLKVHETDQRLCTVDLPNCSEADSLVAINLPEEKKIILNRSRWQSLDAQAKIRLALHEVFGVTGIEENEYHVSSFFAPLVYVEDFNVDFLADELRAFLVERKIFPLYVGDYYDQVHFQDRAILLMDCISLVEQRFPGRMDIGMVSLRKKVSWSGFDLGKNEALGRLDLNPVYLSELAPQYSHLKDVGKHILYLDQDTTLQQCYNKIVALGLKN